MISGVGITHFLIVSTLMFFIGIYGFLTRKNLITILIAIELILNSVAINFIIINKYLFPGKINGQIFSIFIIAVAAAEVAIAIAVVIDFYRINKEIDVDKSEMMKY
ncbi:MAG TPA: NADH-quinone oxidoreductase subunit NuoK [Bacteroidetes bacterium]|jgi:NADH-quinone oxidoreductase subunit K|nr:NADH-quinone oxidoreductase subunit NuoK [Bacteroidota bacterium]